MFILSFPARTSTSQEHCWKRKDKWKQAHADFLELFPLDFRFEDARLTFVSMFETTQSQPS